MSFRGHRHTPEAREKMHAAAQRSLRPFHESYRIIQETGCWEWTGNINNDRYGRGPWNGRRTRANRISWMVNRGPIPKGMHVLHRCDNPPCVNPDHLFLGTHADNMADKVRKIRHCIGEKNGCAKLTEAQVRAIREDKRPGPAVARDYSISNSSVSLIRRREAWTHLD